MQVTLLDCTQDAENQIGKAAAICYDAKTDRESNIRRANKCKDSGHLTVLRFGYASFNISGISRICSHQLVRIAIAGILQESQRYVEQTNVEFIRPASVPESLAAKWDELERLSVEVYQEGIKSGMKKEDARYALLHSATTQVNLCLNFQAWRDLLKNRCAKSAQWEVREVAQAIGKELHKIAPNLFEEYS